MDLKIDNLVKNGKKSPTLSKFLTISEQDDLNKYKKEVKIIFSTTYEDEERKRAFIYPNDLDITPTFKISIYKIISKGKFKHPEILGSIMSLGVNRDVIGDIIVDEESYIICANEIEKYIVENLQKISNMSIELEKVEKMCLNTLNNYIETSIIIPSLRLDAIISKVVNTSRENAQELISSRHVKINGDIILKNDYICKENDIISILKYGRVIIHDISRKTKKDKLVLNILKTK